MIRCKWLLAVIAIVALFVITLSRILLPGDVIPVGYLPRCFSRSKQEDPAGRCLFHIIFRLGCYTPVNSSNAQLLVTQRRLG